MEREDFCKRLTQLRMNKGVSARDMSLSIGQSPNYINGIENGENYPSMATFFYICDYFGITPRDFFDIDADNPSKAKAARRYQCGSAPAALFLLIWRPTSLNPPGEGSGGVCCFLAYFSGRCPADSSNENTAPESL